MAEFDPYYIWLGIPPDEQPPDHYRLLGIRKFETNPDVIANAAEQRATHVRSMQVGMRQERSQKILNEIFLAARVLLNLQTKVQYDSRLAERLTQLGQLQRPIAVATTVVGSNVVAPVGSLIPPPVVQQPPQAISIGDASREGRTAQRRGPQRRPPSLISGWALGLVLALLTFSLLYIGGVLTPEKRGGRVADRTKPKNIQSPVLSQPRTPVVSTASGIEVSESLEKPAVPQESPDVSPLDVDAEAPRDSKQPSIEQRQVKESADAPPEDEVLTALNAAKQRREDLLVEAHTKLLKAFDDGIVAAAKAKEPKVVEALVEQKERFADAEVRPTVPEIAEAFEEYLATRKHLDSDLNRAYTDATLAYAEKLLTAQSKEVAEEGRAFVADEQAELARLAGKESPAPTDREIEEPEMSATARLVNSFVEAYEKELEKADEQETIARFEQVMKDLPGKMDTFLKGATWTIHCPIVEVREGSTAGNYAIHVAAPEEFRAFDLGSRGERWWQMRSSVTMRLKKEQALAVEPGHLLVITATPRFPSKRTSGEDYVFLQRPYFQGRNNDVFQHYIEFLKVKIDIRDSSKIDTSESRDGKARKAKSKAGAALARLVGIIGSGRKWHIAYGGGSDYRNVIFHEDGAWEAMDTKSGKLSGTWVLKDGRIVVEKSDGTPQEVIYEMNGMILAIHQTTKGKVLNEGVVLPE